MEWFGSLPIHTPFMIPVSRMQRGEALLTFCTLMKVDVDRFLVVDDPTMTVLEEIHFMDCDRLALCVLMKVSDELAMVTEDPTLLVREKLYRISSRRLVCCQSASEGVSF